MRSEKEMFDLILAVANEDNRIRGVYMNGSRTNPKAPKDIFQDYDIVYLVTETASFIADVDWTKVYGESIIIQKPDELDKMHGGETHFEQCYGYLMQFADGNRIDLHIKTLDSVLEEFQTDKLTITLLDKDNVLPKLPEPTDVDYWVKRPTADLYFRCCNEFHWVLLYIGKGLWREETLYAMDHLNFYVRPQLFVMLSWYAGTLTNFSCSVGKKGKYIDQYLPGDIWERYLATFSKADTNAIWEATFLMCDLFEELAIKISMEFGFVYLEDEARKCIEFMKHIKQLPKDAKVII